MAVLIKVSSATRLQGIVAAAAEEAAGADFRRFLDLAEAQFLAARATRLSPHRGAPVTCAKSVSSWPHGTTGLSAAVVVFPFVCAFATFPFAAFAACFGD